MMEKLSYMNNGYDVDLFQREFYKETWWTQLTDIWTANLWPKLFHLTSLAKKTEMPEEIVYNLKVYAFGNSCFN